MLRLVLDINVLVSALLWQGKPGQLVALAASGDVLLFGSTDLTAEFIRTLDKPKLMRPIAATGLSGREMIEKVRRLTTLVRSAPLPVPVSRDPDDDAVLACAVAARADLIVSGDADLLVLGTYAGIPIVTVADALARVSTAADKPGARSDA